jgi:hypothetical protein
MSSSKYNNKEISSPDLRALIEKHGIEKVIILPMQWRDGRAKRADIMIYDPETKTEYAYEKVHENTYTRIRSPEEREYDRVGFGFSGDTDFGKNSRDIENYIVSLISTTQEVENEDGDKIKKTVVSPAKLKKYKFVNEQGKKVPVKIISETNKISRKWKGTINNPNASEEDKKEFAGIHYVNLDNVKGERTFYRDFLDVRTVQKKPSKGRKKPITTMEKLTDEEGGPVSLDNIHELIPSGSNVKFKAKRQAVISAQGFSVKFDMWGKIYVTPREVVKDLADDFEDDELEDLIAKFNDTPEEESTQKDNDAGDLDSIDD